MMCWRWWCREKVDSSVAEWSDDNSSRRRLARGQLAWLEAEAQGWATSDPSSVSLLAGRWLLVRTENRAAYDDAIAVTNTDTQVSKMLNRGNLIVTYEPRSSSGLNEWTTTFETEMWGVVKMVVRIGEEGEEMSVDRQWLRSVYRMKNRHTMVGIRTFRNGIRCYVVREVLPSTPNILNVSHTVGEVTCTHVFRRLADGEVVPPSLTSSC